MDGMTESSNALCMAVVHLCDSNTLAFLTLILDTPFPTPAGAHFAVRVLIVFAAIGSAAEGRGQWEWP